MCTLFAAYFGIPARAQTITATVDAGSAPHAMAVNPLTNQIYVINSAPEGTLTVIDGATYAATTVPVGSNPSAVAVDTATNTAYVASLTQSTVTEVDGGTFDATTISLGATPGAAGISLIAIAANPVTNRIYVADLNDSNGYEGSVTVIDGGTNTLTTTAQGINPGASGINPNIIAVNTVTDMIYVDNASGGYVTVIDGNTNGAVGVAPGTNPSSLVVDEASDTVYAASSTSATVAAINGSTNATTSINVGTVPGAMAVNPVTNRLYVLSGQSSGTLTVVDGATHATTTVPVGSNPSAIAVDSATNRIYVLNETAPGSVTVIDGATNATTAVKLGSYPFAMALNTATDTLYILQDSPNASLAVLNLSGSAAPIISAGPQSQTVETGTPAVFTVAAAGEPSPTYQWSFDGAPLGDANGVSGSSTSTLFIGAGAKAADAGSYTCTVANASGRVTSPAAILQVVSSPTPGRLVNLSSRAGVWAGGGVLVTGFVVSGSGSKDLILRGVGPALGAFGVSGALAAPVLSLFDSASPSNLVTADSGWQVPPSAPAGAWSGRADPVDATQADFTQAGAFGLPAGSADCAVKISLPAGSYTSQVEGAGGASGVALSEVYDADAGNTGAQLVNLSCRGEVGTAGSVMITGFVIAGSTSETVLIRASGPALGAFGVTGVLADPSVRLLDSGQYLLASDSGWGGNQQIVGAAASVGAFPWNDPASADSAILVTLPPGSYTVETSGNSGDTGIALLEVYSVP